jgi:ribosomal protein S18 acetylase RimI-like enzyme
VFSITDGFESLAAGCVLHTVVEDMPSTPGPIGLWPDSAVNRERLALLERLFADQKARYFRCYLPLPSADTERPAPTGSEYAQAVEVGLAARLADIEAVHASHREDSLSRLIPVRSTEDWQRKKQLYQSAPAGPDGHDMQNGRFADFERLKCTAGYMDSYLFMHRGTCKGTVSLAIKGRFARLKNLFIHPEYRQQGLGRLMITLALLESRHAGATMVGVYALQDGSSHALYRSLGMQDITAQIEWCKPLTRIKGHDQQ